MLIQAILTAAAMNLRKLAQHTRRIDAGARALALSLATRMGPPNCQKLGTTFGPLRRDQTLIYVRLQRVKGRRGPGGGRARVAALQPASSSRVV
jgi:hypothetical protein